MVIDDNIFVNENERRLVDENKINLRGFCWPSYEQAPRGKFANSTLRIYKDNIYRAQIIGEETLNYELALWDYVGIPAAIFAHEGLVDMYNSLSFTERIGIECGDVGVPLIIRYNPEFLSATYLSGERANRDTRRIESIDFKAILNEVKDHLDRDLERASPYYDKLDKMFR